MAKSNETIIPLTEQPEYQEAVARVVKISRAHSATSEKLEQCRARLASVQESSDAHQTPGLIDRALGIAAGSLGVSARMSTAESQPILTMTAEISRLEVEAKELYNGLRAANQVVDNIATSLARSLGQATKARHIAAVAHIRSCLAQLCAANDVEVEVRVQLEKLGYHSHGLPNQGFSAIGGMDESWGSPAFYFNRNALEYIASEKLE